MMQFIQDNGGFLATVVFVVLFLNAILSGVAGVLELVKDKTKSEADNKAYTIIQKCISMLQKVLDFLSANKQHK